MSFSRRRGDEDEEDTPWITWWCSFRGNEFMCEIPLYFIRDPFNLTGLNSQ
eukprot:Awhi_evm1s108